MYFSPGALLAMKSRLSRMFCAVTRGPKQYHEHQPVGGLGVLSGGWFLARAAPTAPSATSRDTFVAVKKSSRSHDSPGPSVNPSASITTCSADGARRGICPGTRRAETNPSAWTGSGDWESVIAPKTVRVPAGVGIL